MKVLIVEDDRVLSLMLTRMVQRIGHEVVGTLTEGEIAVETMRSNSVDLVLMDIMLEGKIDGIDAMEQIRGTSDVDVIYVTGNSDNSTIERAQKTNYVEYLVKPIVYEQLKQAIDKI
ncbi:MAG: response regulator [Balneolaceae bacterium]|nr:response regulator [Balneolaceae bacterium]